MMLNNTIIVAILIINVLSISKQMKIFIILILLIFPYTANCQVPKLKPLKEKYMSQTIVPYEKKGKWGYAYIEEEGKKPKFIIDNIFEEARPFVDTISIVKSCGQYGILSRRGVFISAPQYDIIEDFEDGRAFVKKDKISGYINVDGIMDIEWIEEDNGNITLKYKDVMASFINIVPSTYKMGEKSDVKDLFYDAVPIHDVNLTNSFKIGETEVTQDLWLAVMGDNPSFHKSQKLPVENISWNDCQNFIDKLNSLSKLSFRLPTEAEWEYVASFDQWHGSLNDIGWYVQNSNGITHPVKSLKPNPLGVYDILGNVSEWCHDWYNSHYYNDSETKNPSGPQFGVGRVRRGGSYNDNLLFCSPKYRNSNIPTYRSPGLGFRLILINNNN